MIKVSTNSKQTAIWLVNEDNQEWMITPTEARQLNDELTRVLGEDESEEVYYDLWLGVQEALAKEPTK